MFSRNNFEKKIEEKVKFWLEQPELGWISDFKQTLPDAEMYLVGGCLRDIAIGRESKDLDFVVKNVAPDKLQESLSSLGNVVLVGRNFGVFKFRPLGFEQHEFDIALPRTEHAFGIGGYRDVETQSKPTLPLEHDLARRDFTINALAYDIKKKIILDPYHGLIDLKKKIIRTVGEPRERFQEDYSRLLRALRFVCVIDGKLEEKTSLALKDFIPKINERKNLDNGDIVTDETRQVISENWQYILPAELITQELVKTLMANPKRFWEIYQEYNLWPKLIPDFAEMKGCEHKSQWHREGDVYNHMALVLEAVNDKRVQKFLNGRALHPDIYVAALFHDLGKPQAVIEISTGRHFYGHEQISAKRWQEIQKILPFAVAGVDIDIVQKLVANHMQFNDVKFMQKKTILKYYGGEVGEKQILLGMMDVAGSRQGRFKQGNFDNINHILEQLEIMKDEGFILPEEKFKLKKPLIDGIKIMKLWHIDGSKYEQHKWIGILKSAALEAELQGKFKDQNLADLPNNEIKDKILSYLNEEGKEAYNKLFNS